LDKRSNLPIIEVKIMWWISDSLMERAFDPVSVLYF